MGHTVFRLKAFWKDWVAVIFDESPCFVRLLNINPQIPLNESVRQFRANSVADAKVLVEEQLGISPGSAALYWQPYEAMPGSIVVKN